MSVQLLKSLVKWLGSAIAITAIAFVVYRLWNQSSELPPGALEEAAPNLVVASLAYAGCGFFLALLWWLVLRAAGFRSATLPKACGVFLASQLGKYLPGNFGHFAARHVLSRQHGASHRSLVAATLLEALLLIAAAGTMAILVVKSIVSDRLELVMDSVWLAPVVAIVTLVLGMSLARARGWLDSELGQFRLVLELSAAFGLALLFFLASAGCFVLMSTSQGAGDWASLVPWIAAAWLLGFLVPGAPGGLGVREFVLVMGLTPLIGESQAALDALLFRLVTVGGDAVASAIGAVWLRQQSKMLIRE